MSDVFQRHLKYAFALEQQGRIREALEAYDQAIIAVPGHAFAFSRRAMILFRQRFGPPGAPAPRDGRPRIGMTTLGENGRFGNQLLQYGFLRMYAAEHELTAETPDWIGRDLFDLTDPAPGEPMPLVKETEVDFAGSLNRTVPEVWRHADLWGYFCYPTGGLRRHRDLFRRLYRPGRKVTALAAAAEKALRARGDTLVVIHLRRGDAVPLRRGDAGSGRYWIAPADWYARWLEPLWPTLRRPVLYVATDDPASAAELARFAPVTARDLALEIPGAEFYPDFHLLTQADLLAMSNSTFSFVAAMLNTRATAFLRPNLERGALVEFDPWDAPVLP